MKRLTPKAPLIFYYFASVSEMEREINRRYKISVGVFDIKKAMNGYY